MDEIKIYKNEYRIILYQGDDIITKIPINDIFKIVNSWIKFIKIDGKIINISDIRIIEPLLDKNKTKEEIIRKYREREDKKER